MLIIHFVFKSSNTDQTLFRHPYLEQIGFVINNELKVLICEGCGCACTPKGIKDHLNKKHQNGKDKRSIDQAQVQAICDAQHITASLPIPDPTQVHLQFLGLRIHEGFGCAQCNYICGEVSSLETHYKQQADHPGQPPSSPPKIHYQHLTGRGKGSTFLKVTPRAVPTSTDILEDMIADLRKAANSAGGDPASKLNARQINPWMLTTKWYLHVEGADPLALKVRLG
ncbi:hypothetical protein FIBSPDRAFT_949579 [Athelia psychrophila]|uniref:C2H2-type domain-containing protein n=1 Tax=Athelia psychrophila TaxID=1759441 RepID=A0A166PHD5_9AGAM|nr:hypothetical protein FIBSPDRAFT_949579 [Fibularhizoctonia sp. CBS 109695]